jgi:hypothetical protein
LIDPRSDEMPAQSSASSQKVWPFNDPGVAHRATVKIG